MQLFRNQEGESSFRKKSLRAQQQVLDTLVRIEAELSSFRGDSLKAENARLAGQIEMKQETAKLSLSLERFLLVSSDAMSKMSKYFEIEIKAMQNIIDREPPPEPTEDDKKY